MRSQALFFISCVICSICLCGCGPPLVTVGLRAEYPEQSFRLYLDTPPGAFVPVDSLQPTLRWESFPRSKDLEQKIGQVENVVYQLRILGKEFTYARDDLREPCHRMDVPLKPSEKYLWTVRACFELKGENRCTVWGALSKWEYWTFSHPNSWSYRFQTPAK